MGIVSANGTSDYLMVRRAMARTIIDRDSSDD